MFLIDEWLLASVNDAECLLTYNGIPVSENDVIPLGGVLTLTPIGGLVFGDGDWNGVVYFRGQDPVTLGIVFTEWDISPDSKTATLEITQDEYGALYIFTKQLPFTLNQNILDSLNAANVKAYFNETELGLGDSLDSGDVLILKGDGVVFNESTSFDDGTYFRGQDPEYLTTTYTHFDLSVDLKTASITITGDYWLYYNLVIDSEQVTEVSGSNNVFIIDSDKLTAINNERFVRRGDLVIDYADYILSVLEIPFEVNPNDILQPELIKLADLETTVEADKLNTDLLKIDLGEITVLEVENNVLDFLNTSAILRLPMADPILLEIDYVMGETISIEYLLDCYTGVANINVSSSKTGGVIASSTVDIGVNIPFTRTGNSANLDNSNIQVGGENGVSIPYIELVKNDSLLKYGFFTVPIVDESLLIGNSGFIVVEEIELKVNALSSEKMEIENILKSGVIINE